MLLVKMGIITFLLCCVVVGVVGGLSLLLDEDEKDTPIEPNGGDTTLELTLPEAQESSLVEVDVRGRGGISSILVNLESKSEDPVRILILPGVLFQAQSSETQNMITTGTKTVLLEPYQSRNRVSLDAACANMELSAPGESDSLIMSKSPLSGDLHKLLSIPEFADERWTVQQFAIWTITDNPSDRSDYTAIGSGFSLGGVVPSESTMVEIRDLFIAAGISTGKYTALAEIEEQ